jgi:chemotaxis signal transduction protein
MSTREEDAAILQTRAQALAAPRRTEHAEVERHALFERAGVRYALAMRYVFGVARVLSPTPLPGAGAHWLGVSSLHGELLAIVDIDALFSGQRAVAQEPKHASALAGRDADTQLILVVGLAQRELGVAIDAVLDAVRIEGGLARETSDDGRSEELLQGVTSEGTRVLLAEALLLDPRLFIENSEPRET